METAEGTLVVLAFISVYVIVGIAARRFVRPKPVKVKGQVPPPPAWLPNALEKMGKWGTWECNAGLKRDDNTGEPLHYYGELRSKRGGDLITVTVPYFEQIITTQGDDKFTAAVIDFTEYRYRRNPLWLLVAGRFPSQHVVTARGRLQKLIPKSIKAANKAAARL